MAETTESPKVAPAANGVQPEPKRAPQIGEGRVMGSEYARQDWVANLEDGTTLEDIMRPEFWSHNAARFQPYATIECRAEDGTWIAYLVVTGCDRTWAMPATRMASGPMRAPMTLAPISLGTPMMLTGRKSRCFISLPFLIQAARARPGASRESCG